MSGIDRIAEAFESARADGRRAALMPYMMAGYPSLEASRAVAEGYIAAGADLIEFGIPFSDPLADGPVIHAAATQALGTGIRVDDALALAAEIAARVPVIVMVYINPILARGIERFIDGLAQIGVCGLIVPDVPQEEAGELLEAADRFGIALVPLIAPTTPDDRMAEIGARARGFVYTVAVTGTTGERADADFGPLVARARAATSVPVAVGFGISSAEQAAAAADAGADGVIVGTRFVRAAGEDPDGLEELVTSFARALR